MQILKNKLDILAFDFHLPLQTASDRPISAIEPATLEDMYEDLCPEQAKYIPPDIVKTKYDVDISGV